MPGQGLARARIQHLNDQRTTRLHVHVHLCTTDAIGFDSVQMMATVWLTCRVVAPAVGMVMGLVRTCAEVAPVPF